MKNKSIPAWRLELSLHLLLQAKAVLPPGEELDEVGRMIDECSYSLEFILYGPAYPELMPRCIPITEPIKRRPGRPRKAAAMPTAAPKAEQPETDAP